MLGGGCGEKGSLWAVSRNANIVMMENSTLRFLKILKNRYYYLTLLSLSYASTGKETIIQGNFCTPVFTTVLFMRTKIGKHLSISTR